METLIPIASALPTAATWVYGLTLYPGLNRGLSWRKPLKLLAKHRALIGVIANLLAIAHTLQTLYLYPASLEMHSGIACLGAISLLGLTSGKKLQTRLGKSWRLVHSITYLIPLLLLWHISEKMQIWSGFTMITVILLVVITVLQGVRSWQKVQQRISKGNLRHLSKLDCMNPKD
ncbi:MAG: hypothetical protein SFT94_07860 [Pseudanabaenaceae cyanobacterium bins.68]|nr:hypothetical protein [Pseudanabaenaceae cyanobacterium bins.68]